MKQWILKQIRWKISSIGEYCNNNPFDDITYMLYLTLVDIFYE